MKWFPLLFCTAMLLCGSFSLFAQTKTERVAAHLGTFRFENDKPIGSVKFIFQRAVLTREGNGRKTYKQLLITQRGFTNNDNAGNLLAVQVIYKGEEATIYAEPKSKNTGRIRVQPPVESAPVAPPELVQSRRHKRGVARAVPAQIVNESPVEPQVAVQTEQPSPDPVRPRALFPDQQQSHSNARPGSTNISLPDSSTLAQSLDGAKQTMTGWKAKLWQSAQPIWEFVMWTFNSLIVLLVCFAGLCRYVAKTAAAESKISPKGRVITGRWIIGAHQNASGLLLIITWFIAIFFLIDIFMWLIYLDLPIWLLVVIWFPTLWLAEKITSWIVPNLRGDESHYA
jgi:hypothetical protein